MDSTIVVALIGMVAGSAGIVGAIGAVGALGRTSRLRLRVDRSISSAELLPEGDSVRRALMHSVKADLAEIASRQLVRLSYMSRMCVVFLGTFGTASYLTVFVFQLWEDETYPSGGRLVLLLVSLAAMGFAQWISRALTRERWRMRRHLISGEPAHSVVDLARWQAGVILIGSSYLDPEVAPDQPPRSRRSRERVAAN